MADSYWGQLLTLIPPDHKLVLRDLTHIETIGFIGKPNQCPLHLKVRASDPKMVQKIMSYGIDFKPDSYKQMTPTHAGAFNATRRFDKLPEFALPEDVVQEAQQMLQAYYKPYFDTCELTPEESMQWNRKASPGYYFKSQFGYTSTGQVLDNPHAMDEMRDFLYNPSFPTLWSTAVKEEMLPAAKVDENMPRTFIIPDKRFHYLCQHLFLSQHKLFVSLAQDLSKVQTGGYNFFSGGFSRLMEYMSQYAWILEGDCSKWDCSLIMKLFQNFVWPIRRQLFKPDGVTFEQRRYQRVWFENVMMDVYYDMVYCYVRLPNGQVLLIKIGMKSGFLLTSDDNTLIHHGITNCVLVMAKKTYDCVTEAFFKLMSDDHIAGSQTDSFIAFEFRRDCYARFGITLKPEADFVSRSMEGHTFLGFKATWSDEYGTWVPVFNIDRLCCMLTTNRGKVDPAIQFARINACRILAFFTQYREHFAQMAKDFYRVDYLSMNPYEAGSLESLEYESLCSLWTTEEVEGLWFGHERKSSGDGLKNQLVENDTNQDTKGKKSGCASGCQEITTSGVLSFLEEACAEASQEMEGDGEGKDTRE